MPPGVSAPGGNSNERIIIQVKTGRDDNGLVVLNSGSPSARTLCGRVDALGLAKLVRSRRGQELLGVVARHYPVVRHFYRQTFAVDGQGKGVASAHAFFHYVFRNDRRVAKFFNQAIFNFISQFVHEERGNVLTGRVHGDSRRRHEFRVYFVRSLVLIAIDRRATVLGGAVQ